MGRHDYMAEAHVLRLHAEGDTFDGFELRQRGTLHDMIQYVMSRPSTNRRHLGIYVPESGDCLGPDEIKRSSQDPDYLDYEA